MTETEKDKKRGRDLCIALGRNKLFPKLFPKGKKFLYRQRYVPELTVLQKLKQLILSFF
jgi:hypothetical protein